ncbi:MAG: UMF1 family MFS transporter [Alphaproteobacteria bacterium]|jgi:UMF1 family MFS transporter
MDTPSPIAQINHPINPNPLKNRRGLVSWCLYDAANSAFPTVITTFIFGAYFTQAIAETPESGAADWGLAIGLSGAAVAIASPLLGAVADRGGRRKPWLALLTALCVFATAMLWFAEPNSGNTIWALFFVALGLFGFELGMVFYNAMLSDLAPAKFLGRLSGWGWGCGYIGGLVCLALSLVGFVQTETPWFGVPMEAAQNIRAVAVLTAVWFAVLSLPLFLFTPDRAATGLSFGAAARDGMGQIAETFRHAREYKGLGRYLLAHMIYADGLNTLFAFGGIYAAGAFGMSLSEVIQFGIALNVTAGLGAMAFAWVDDRIGAKPVVVIALLALIMFSTGLLLVESKALFWMFGMGLGVFVGPAQAASRSLMVGLSPPDMQTEMFGLYALSGKATAFAGPLLVGAVTAAFDSQRAGMAVIVVFFVAGLILLLPVREPRPNPSDGNGASR